MNDDLHKVSTLSATFIQALFFPAEKFLITNVRIQQRQLNFKLFCHENESKWSEAEHYKRDNLINLLIIIEPNEVGTAMIFNSMFLHI